MNDKIQIRDEAFAAGAQAVIHAAVVRLYEHSPADTLDFLRDLVQQVEEDQ